MIIVALVWNEYVNEIDLYLIEMNKMMDKMIC